MSLLKKYKVIFGDSKKNYGEDMVFTPTLTLPCRFIDKKSISMDVNDEFMNFDATVVVDDYKPATGDYCKIEGFNTFYQVVDTSPLQNLRNSKNKYSIKLKLVKNV